MANSSPLNRATRPVIFDQGGEPVAYRTEQLVAGGVARYRRKVLVVDEEASRAALIPESHNYPGFKGIAGPKLLARLREQALLYGAPLERGRVSSLHRHPEGNFLASWTRGEICARTVMVASGLVDETANIDGINEREI